MSIIIDNCDNCQAIAFFLPFNALKGPVFGKWDPVLKYHFFLLIVFSGILPTRKSPSKPCAYISRPDPLRTPLSIIQAFLGFINYSHIYGFTFIWVYNQRVNV